MSTTKYAKRVTPMGIPATRLDYLPDLIDIQKKSFEWFLKEGLKEELLAFSPVSTMQSIQLKRQEFMTQLMQNNYAL